MARTKNVNVKRRSKSGKSTKLRTTAIKLNSTQQFCIPKLPFARLVREIIFAHLDKHPEYELSKYDVRLQNETMECLHLATEEYLINFFECLQLLTSACKRVTIMQQDINLYLALKNVMK